MKKSTLIDTAEQIIGGKMELDYFSRMSGTVIFRQYRENIAPRELENIRHQLAAYGIQSQLQTTEREFLLRLLLDYSRVKKENRKINLLLFLATMVTTTLTGAILKGNNPFLTLQELFSGIGYSVAIMSILTAHEMGHYYYAIRNKIYATLPYFIPFFIPAFNFGTFGAFIKMRSPIPDKRALLDVGIAGPLAGFAVSLFFLILGFSLLPDQAGVIAYVEQIHEWSETGEGALTLGNSILFDFLRHVMGATHLPMYEVYHFPFIFAGWIGLFVTALNLMPIGQLDGGHISYALLGARAKIVGVAAFIALALLNFYSTNWIIWTILVLILIRLKHPPTLNDAVELDGFRKSLAWISYIIFITCFAPMPLYFG